MICQSLTRSRAMLAPLASTVDSRQSIVRTRYLTVDCRLWTVDPTETSLTVRTHFPDLTPLALLEQVVQLADQRRPHLRPRHRLAADGVVGLRVGVQPGQRLAGGADGGVEGLAIGHGAPRPPFVRQHAPLDPRSPRAQGLTRIRAVCAQVPARFLSPAIPSR